MKKEKTALVTGITGFVGSHMAELLLAKGFEVHGLCRWRSRKENIESVDKKVHLVEGDLVVGPCNLFEAVRAAQLSPASKLPAAARSTVW